MRNFNVPTLFGLLFLIPSLGCPPEDKEEDTDIVADTDTDTEPEPEPVAQDPNSAQTVDDADVSTPYAYHITGAATLTGVEGAYEAVAGTLTYGLTVDEAVVCDLDVAFAGTPYLGTCEGCDFAFDIAEATVTRDGGTKECSPISTLSFIEDEFHTNLILAHADTYVGAYYDYADALLSGYSYDYYGTIYPGPYFTFVSYDGEGSNGTYTPGEGGFSWTFDFEGLDTNLDAYTTYCEYNYTYLGYYAVDGGEGGTSALDCAGTITDVWTFDAPAGATAYISIDTIAADSAFDVAFYLNAPDGCYIGYADDAFDCAFPPTEYQCPAATFEDLDGGTYEVVVISWDSCTGETAEYDFQVAVTTPG